MNRQSGFGAIMAIIILVILASLAVAIIRFGMVQQLGSAQDIQSAKAWQAAKTGCEWGLYQAFKGTWTSCNNATQTLDLSADTGFQVTVNCNSTEYDEGESTPGTAKKIRVYTLFAVACNSSGACPDDTMATSPTYVERMRQVIATH
ncbi:MAG: pilus assembly PilX N-terminal domain-containing protein [Methylococcaceae bacterium]|nr:pilus assembly PilX N-terminal domain-containing protein [Methylococcaceae bacterium]